MINLVLGTNVLIYALNSDSEFHGKASAILQNEENLLFLTTKNISEFFAVSSKLGLDLQKVLEFYEDLSLNTTILFPSGASLAIFRVLLEKYQPKGNRIYDLEIVSIMIAQGLKKIATFNI
ncbi:MAG: type II toxin-antitoxin system VapC family toxin [Microscillaceae bacterium]|nr:type II toxin-antitoxin system VapC family toxin [Microscillaceae bacterium]